MNNTRLIAMPPPKILPSRVDFVNALMPPKKDQNAFVQSIIRHFSMYSEGLSICAFQIIFTFIFFPYPQIVLQNHLLTAK
jgi:hypothetical protein